MATQVETKIKTMSATPEVKKQKGRATFESLPKETKEQVIEKVQPCHKALRDMAQSGH